MSAQEQRLWDALSLLVGLFEVAKDEIPARILSSHRLANAKEVLRETSEQEKSA